MTSITEFILARVAEDEEAAKAAYQGEWREHDAFVYTGTDSDDEPTVYINGGIYANQRRTALHIARHDPARALAECESKRRIVEHFTRDRMSFWGEIALVPLGAIASVWGDHPDFREEWRR